MAHEGVRIIARTQAQAQGWGEKNWNKKGQEEGRKCENIQEV